MGDATAQAARAAGFADVRSASGAGRDLLALILRDAPPGPILHLGARRPAFDLVKALTAAGRQARAFPLYDTIAARVLPPAVALSLAAGEVCAVLIHSPAAARALAGFAETDPDLGGWLGGAALVALSPDCAAPLATTPFAARATASAPDESSLLEALLGAGPAHG